MGHVVMAKNNHINPADDEVKIGNIGRRSERDLAEDCIRIIELRKQPMAVTIDPQGWVWVEPAEHAAESDLVGVWSPPETLAEQCAAQAAIRECLIGERRAA